MVSTATKQVFCAEGLKLLPRPQDSGYTKRLAGQSTFTENSSPKIGHDGFLAARRHHGEFHLGQLDVKDCIGRVALRKDSIIDLVFAYSFPGNNPGHSRV